MFLQEQIKGIIIKGEEEEEEKKIDAASDHKERGRGRAKMRSKRGLKEMDLVMHHVIAQKQKKPILGVTETYSRRKGDVLYIELVGAQLDCSQAKYIAMDAKETCCRIKRDLVSKHKRPTQFLNPKYHTSGFLTHFGTLGQ